MEELQALQQAIDLLQKYRQEISQNGNGKVEKIMEEIKESFDLPKSSLKKIEELLKKPDGRKRARSVTLDEADKYMLKGLLMKAGVRMSKKLKEVLDFDKDYYDIEGILKALEDRKKRMEKVVNAG